MDLCPSWNFELVLFILAKMILFFPVKILTPSTKCYPILVIFLFEYLCNQCTILLPPLVLLLWQLLHQLYPIVQ